MLCIWFYPAASYAPLRRATLLFALARAACSRRHRSDVKTCERPFAIGRTSSASFLFEAARTLSH